MDGISEGHTEGRGVHGENRAKVLEILCLTRSQELAWSNYETNELDMKPAMARVWTALYFSATLCAIFLVANLVGSKVTEKSDVGLTSFIRFLPMAFWFNVNANQKNRDYVAALEARIEVLERKDES